MRGLLTLNNLRIVQAQMTENFPQSFHEYFNEMGNQHKYNAMGSKKK